mgnify:CR=1 FL=1
MNNMKVTNYNKILGFLSVILILLTLYNQQVSGKEFNFTVSPKRYAASVNLELFSLKYEPYPVQPGETVEVWLKIENRGSQVAKQIVCEIVPKYPLKLKSYEERRREFSNIAPFEQILLKYELIVDPKAVASGDEEVELQCTDDLTLSTWKILNFTISVRPREPAININVNTHPEIISPGSDAKIIVGIKNDISSVIRDLKISLNLSTTPLVQIGEISEKKVNVLFPKEKVNLTFNVKALPETSGGIYRIPIVIRYTDESGNKYSKIELVGIEIGAEPEIYITVDSTTISKSNSIGNVILKIVNLGLTDLKFVNLELKEINDKYKVLSSNKMFIGDLDSNDYETAEFKLAVKSKKDIVLPIRITFRDTSNRQYSKNIKVKLRLLSSKELGETHTTRNLILISIIIAFFVFVFYRKWEKKHREEGFLDWVETLIKKIARLRNRL